MAPVADKQRADRVMSVVTRRAGTVFHRSGLEFSWHSTVVREAEIGTERFDRILAEPQLRCTLEKDQQ
jgi:hypothetical protein